MKKYIFALAALLGSCSAYAQYNQNIAVDGTYIPEIIPAERLGLYPQAVKFAMETTPLQYSLRGVDTSFAPQALALPATGWQSNRLFSTYRGYLDLGLGSWLNGNLSAGYRFVDTENTTAGIYLQHSSTSLWHPRLNDATRDRRMWHYDETIGVFLSHLFDGKGRLGAAIDYHLGNFNYYSYIPLAECGENEAANPTQTLNDVAARISWNSVNNSDFSYGAAAGVRYFGYRSLYMQNPVSTDPFRLTGGRETDVNIAANMAYKFGYSSIGLDLDGNILSYNDLKTANDEFEEAPDTYGTLALTPAYRFRNDNVNLQIGARVDLTMNGRTYYGNRYDTFRIAPAIKASYTKDAFALYLNALGGTSLHTLAGEYNSDYYSLPGLLSTAPVYRPLDGRIGVEIGPFAGFSAAFEEAYAVNLGVYTGGLYAKWLNSEYLRPTLDRTYNTRGFSTLLRLSYDAGKYFKITAEGTINPGSIGKSYFNGYDHARYTAKISAETNPWSTLKFNLDYSFRGRRDIAYYAADTEIGEDFFTERLHNLNMLNFGVSYGITDAFSVWGRADNLLNRHDAVTPELPSQGIALSAGISLCF